MATHGAEFTKKLRAAIKAKIEELGVEVDEELPDYIMVMVANKKEKNRMKNDLLLFLGKNSGVFVDWLFGFFEKLQNVGGNSAVQEAGPKAKKEDKPVEKEERERAGTSKPRKEEKPRKKEEKKSSKHKSRHDSELVASSKVSSSKPSKPRKSRSPSPSKYRSKPTEKRMSEDVEDKPVKRKRSSPSRRPDYTPETGGESEGERERRELRQVLEKSSKFKVEDELEKRAVEEQKREESEDTYADSDESPPRKTLRSTVVVQSKSHDFHPKLQSEVVVKGRETRETRGHSSLFLRAISDAAFGAPQRSFERDSKHGHRRDFESEDEDSILQVPEITPSTRRTVSSRAIEEKASTFDEIFGDDQPRFVITVKGNAGERTVKERSDSFSEELHERLIDIKDERSTPSPTVDEEQSKDLFVGVENLLPGAKRGDRKRPKRADDPLRAFAKLAGLSPKKARPSEEHKAKSVEQRVVRQVKVDEQPKITVKSNGKAASYKEEPPITPTITPHWNGQSFEIKVADLSSSDDEAEIDELLKTAREIRSSTTRPVEIPPTSVLSKPITYAHAAFVPPGGERRVAQVGADKWTYMQPAPQTIQVQQQLQQMTVVQPAGAPLRAEASRISERCRFWPNCRVPDEQCMYVHPKKTCANFPNCWYGDKCMYIHPKCKFDANCTKPNCPFVHTAQHGGPGTTPVPSTPTQTEATTVTIMNDGVPSADILLVPAPTTQPTTGIAQQNPIANFTTVQCKFKGRCRNPNCTFKHPPRCRFGPNCLNASCSFWHPVDNNKYKWVAPGTAPST